MIWQDMLINEKQELISKYNNIKQQLLKLKGNRSHYNKDEYDKKVLELQQLYNDILPQYRCDNCKTIITLDLKKSKQLFKGNIVPIFCNVKCSGQYYAMLQHANETDTQRKLKNEKISNTLKSKSDKLLETKISKYTNITKNLNNDLNDKIICNYCGNIIKNLSKYKLNQVKLNKPVYCSKACATASRYGKGESSLSDNELIKQIKYYMEKTELNYISIANELRYFIF